MNSGEYLAIYKSQSKLSLNNSNESVYLYDPQNNLVSSISYTQSIKNSSYNFDGESWSWSKYSTPGAKNKFDSKPKVKIEKPKNVFKNIPADFSVSAKDKETKKLKYAWDFGDGKKSRQKKIAHKYIDTGKYTVTLSVSDESQTVEKSFTVNVKNPSRPDIEIVKILPNPAGNDSENETIGLKNNSKKKIDLTGWKIATGSKEKMYNHPIIDELSINPQETKTISRDNSKFSLNNKAGRVALVMPDGKTVDKIEYLKGKIEEDEAYMKIGDEWQWIAENIAGDSLAPDQNEAEFIDDPTGEIEAGDNINEEDNGADGEVLGASNEEQSRIAATNQNLFSPEDMFIFFTRIGFLKSPIEEPNYCPIKTATASLDYLLISSL